jgi:hypothetical protein
MSAIKTSLTAAFHTEFLIHVRSHSADSKGKNEGAVDEGVEISDSRDGLREGESRKF